MIFLFIHNKQLFKTPCSTLACGAVRLSRHRLQKIGMLLKPKPSKIKLNEVQSRTPKFIAKF